MPRGQNKETLIPMGARTPEEVRKITSKGGKRSGEVRKARKTLKETMNMILECVPTDQESKDIMAEIEGLVQKYDYSTVIMAALAKKAKSGDVAAIKELRDLIGEGGISIPGVKVEIVDDLT